jgi:rhodanese-related sulfurtransferase
MNQPYFHNIGFLSSGIKNLCPKQAHSELENHRAILLDVREAHIIGGRRFDAKDILYLPLSLLPQKLHELPHHLPLIVADSVGLRSKEAMHLLIAKGFANIANLAGGLVEWERDGLPINIDKSDCLSGSCVCQLKYRNRGSK